METAFVISFGFLLLLFGTIEYCRLFFMRQLVQNAAREGARYAVVNSTDSTLVSDTQAVVTQRMAKANNMVRNFAVSVYQADSSGNNLGAATNAQFGQYIAVQVDCDYDPILPSFLFMDKTFHLQAKSFMYSEAN